MKTANTSQRVTKFTAKKRPEVALLFGPPNAGKGTVGKYLSTLNNTHVVTMSSVLHGVEGRLGDHIRRYMDNAQLVPCDAVNAAFNQYLCQQHREGGYDPQAQLLVIDGYPRTTEQVRTLDELATVTNVLYLQVPDQELVRRARERGRADDDKIWTRLQDYTEQTEPILQHYASRVARIMGTRPPHEVGVMAQVHLMPTLAKYGALSPLPIEENRGPFYFGNALASR
jgi:adenylate kinase